MPNDSYNWYWIHPYWGKFGSIKRNSEDVPEIQFEVNNILYRVTSEIDATVEVISNLDPTGVYNASVVIPESVDFEDKEYRVAGLADNAFINNTITLIDLPKTIGYIGFNAFSGCSVLSDIACRAQLPPLLQDNSFDSSTYNDASLYVPIWSTSKYKQHSIWGLFSSIDGDSVFDAIHDPEILSYSYNDEDHTASVKAKYNKKEVENLVIPETVIKDGQAYTVTRIEDYGFFGMNGLTGSLIIPNSITHIGRYAFYYCPNLDGKLTIGEQVAEIGMGSFYGTNLSEIKSLAVVPPTLGGFDEYSIEFKTAFDSDCYSSAKLYVPSSAVLAYSYAKEWRNFMISAIEDSGIVDILQDNNPWVKIFNLTGTLLYEGNYNDAQLQKGVYIVISQNLRYKILI